MSAELFRTVISFPFSERKISYRTASVLFGSCFTENIEEKLLFYKFPLLVNPFGIVYNPLSVKKNLERVLANKNYNNDEIDHYNGLYFSFDHHSRFSGTDRNTCLQKINNALSEASRVLKEASFLFLTFGTAYYYVLKSNNRLVSNCHKLPEKDFDRSRASVTEIVQAYSQLIPLLKEYNPDLQIVFTVSPIRHWKDGAHENQLSKSVLLLSIDELCRKFSGTSYFPAYELMLDELRDYRFYEEDMLHPNKVAIDFIWKRFLACYMDKETSAIMNEVEKIQLSRQHRPFNTQGEPFRAFVNQQIKKIQQLTTAHPLIDLSAEYKYFKSLQEDIS